MKQLAPIDLVAPASRGLWTEKKGQLLPPAYATKATNLRIKSNGALTVRKGYTDVTGTELSSKNIESLHEFIKANENVEMIVAWDGGIANDMDDPAGNDISGSVTDTAGNWFFQNFNDKCVGFQDGLKPIVYTGTGNFATVSESSGTAGTGGVGCAAYGRLWQVGSDGNTLNYSGLLDETDWGSASSGSIDFNNIWTNGQDTITAVRGFNGHLVVWGKRHVVFFSDSAGSALGLNPNNMYVTDIVAGTGCVSQHSVQLVGEADVVFLSNAGVQSLARLIQEKSNPIETLSAAIRTDLTAVTRGAAADTIRSLYDEDEQLYWLSFPSSSTSYVFEMARGYIDEETGSPRVPAFEWDLAPYSLVSRENGNINLGMTDKCGLVGGFQDDGSDITFLYESGWLEFGEDFANRLKILKRMGAYIETAWGGSLIFKWATDFAGSFSTRAVVLDTQVGESEWGTGRWGIATWGGTQTLQFLRIAARTTGQYFKIGLTASVDKAFTIQQLELFSKVGRIA